METKQLKLNKLTPAEERVIIHKDTERPGSGEYDDFWSAGLYVCRHCDTPLYKSDSKFDAHCGWPSFDQEVAGRVMRQPDLDGQRTEISCATCGAHLGHIFVGEKLTALDTRHCVNSLSLKFIPQIKIADDNELAIFGGGCFWCLEAIFQRLKGIIKVTSGYAAGKLANPSYEQVASGQSGHAEVVRIEYNPMQISYSDLLEVFFTLHDPSTLNQQGNDLGEQYRSIIIFNSDEQWLLAHKYIDNLEKNKTFKNPIVTEVKPLLAFYPAEDYHLDYYLQNKNQSYCRLVISPKLRKLEQKFTDKLKS